MKRITAALLALIMLCTMFAGCGQDKTPADDNNAQSGNVQPGGDTAGDDKQPGQSGGDTAGGQQTGGDQTGDQTGSDDTPDLPPEPVDTRVYESDVAEALITVAEAYLARRNYVQYDDTRLVNGDAVGVTYRWQNGVNSPEDATSQYTAYSNCAAFCYDVYYYALGLDIVTWSTYMMMNATDMHVYKYDVKGTETDAEKAQIQETFNSQLKQGDLIVYRHADLSNGHVMLYIGDGQIIHCCATGGGNYDYAASKEALEPRGAIIEMTLDTLWNPSHARYMFGMKNFAIMRPTIKYTDAAPSQETLNRIENLKSIYVEKTSSHGAGYTAAPGDEVTFTFTVRNNRKSEAVVEIADTVPSNTTYVSGAEKTEGDKLMWTVKVPSGATQKVSYTVKVNSDAKTGDYIWSEESTVGGVYTRARKIYIGKNLNSDQLTKVSAAAKNNQGSTLRGTALAEKIYADIGLTVELDDDIALLNSIFKPQSGKYYALNTQSEYMSMLAPTMYGGYYTANCETMYERVRTRGMLPSQLMAGDIIVCSKANKAQSYTVMGGNLLFDLTSAKALDLVTSVPTLLTALGYDRFAVIRPAMK